MSHPYLTASPFGGAPQNGEPLNSGIPNELGDSDAVGDGTIFQLPEASLTKVVSRLQRAEYSPFPGFSGFVSIGATTGIHSNGPTAWEIPWPTTEFTATVPGTDLTANPGMAGVFGSGSVSSANVEVGTADEAIDTTTGGSSSDVSIFATVTVAWNVVLYPFYKGVGTDRRFYCEISLSVSAVCALPDGYSLADAAIAGPGSWSSSFLGDPGDYDDSILVDWYGPPDAGEAVLEPSTDHLGQVPIVLIGEEAGSDHGHLTIGEGKMAFLTAYGLRATL